MHDALTPGCGSLWWHAAWRVCTFLFSCVSLAPKGVFCCLVRNIQVVSCTSFSDHRLRARRIVPAFFYKGLEIVQYSAVDRLLQGVCIAALLAATAATCTVVAQYNALFSAAVFVNWARGTLTLGKLGGLLFLLSCGRVWLYWVLFAANLVDQLLAKHIPALRRFAWFNFALWVAYIVLTPAGYYPLPIPPFRPGSTI